MGTVTVQTTKTVQPQIQPEKKQASSNDEVTNILNNVFKTPHSPIEMNRDDPNFKIYV